MQAAVVTSFDSPPRLAEFPDPRATGPGEMVVDVVAAGLHPLVRSQADGSHYSSAHELPLVPGFDGVGRDPDGSLRYFVVPDTTLGAMAEQTVVDARHSFVLPEGSDPVAIAAGMNPGMSSWVALRRRIAFEAGQDVLVLGATGSAGRLAVQVATLLGAGRIVAAARAEDRLSALPELGATATASLDPHAIGRAAADVDVVLDYLWGEPAARAMAAVVAARADPARPLRWVQIGSVAGSTAQIPAAALRSTALQIVGSGLGSVGVPDMVAELPGLAEEITRGSLRIEAQPMPLAAVEQAWADAATATRRLVLTPGP